MKVENQKKPYGENFVFRHFEGLTDNAKPNIKGMYKKTGISVVQKFSLLKKYSLVSAEYRKRT